MQCGPITILRLGEVIKKTGLSRTTIYDGMAAGAFPLSRQLTARSVGWFEHEIDEWLANLPVTRTAA